MQQISLRLVGKRFGWLTVIEDTGKRKNGFVVWICQCDCGGLKEVRTTSLRAGATKSCGCYGRKQFPGVIK